MVMILLLNNNLLLFPSCIISITSCSSARVQTMFADTILQVIVLDNNYSFWFWQLNWFDLNTLKYVLFTLSVITCNSNNIFSWRRSMTKWAEKHSFREMKQWKKRWRTDSHMRSDLRNSKDSVMRWTHRWNCRPLLQQLWYQRVLVATQRRLRNSVVLRCGCRFSSFMAVTPGIPIRLAQASDIVEHLGCICVRLRGI